METTLPPNFEYSGKWFSFGEKKHMRAIGNILPNGKKKVTFWNWRTSESQTLSSDQDGAEEEVDRGPREILAKTEPVKIEAGCAASDGSNETLPYMLGFLVLVSLWTKVRRKKV